jgi:NADPH-dependent 2,4-dienoyl-CoA reductase/sulfur reductase-like enzyme
MTVAVGSVHISSSVAVVGAGPAGLMAADALVAAGHRVTVYEAHRSVGRKFLLAGIFATDCRCGSGVSPCRGSGLG